MKINRLTKALGLMLLMCLCAQAGTDDEIRELIERSCCYIDDTGGAVWDRQRALELCNNNTNAFAGHLRALVGTGNSCFDRQLIAMIGHYGTAEQLPFLYSMVTNAVTGEAAVNAILDVEGVTSNSVAAVRNYLSMTNVDFECRSEVCSEFLLAIPNSSASASLKEDAKGVALQYAMSANRYVMKVDKTFVKIDPSYRNSRRRLAVLRSVNALGVSSYQIGYLTNAINELVAYPESALGE